MENILSKRILLLPKEIKDYINEFNVEHRPAMKYVFTVIKSMELKCFICDAFIHDKPKYDQVYIMKRVIVCSKKCEIIAIEELKNVP